MPNLKSKVKGAFHSFSKWLDKPTGGVEEDKSAEHIMQPLPVHESNTPKQPRASYETRRNEISDNNEQIEGVFYIINDRLVPDYYSECLFSEVDYNPFSSRNKQNPRKRAMFHYLFYKHYIQDVYSDIALSKSEKSLPRGRVEKSHKKSAMIKIDNCYYQNEKIIMQIIELYRLTGEVSIESTSNYYCPKCAGMVRDNYVMQYTWIGEAVSS
jgi:hypothetical protein